MSLVTKWFIDVPSERKEEVADTIKHSRVALEQLSKIILSEIKALDINKFEEYSEPSWAFKQADRLGQLRAYRKILTLLDI